MADEKKKGSVSHQALSIQKEVAYGEGKIKGAADLHQKISSHLQEYKERGEMKIGVDHLENMLTIWLSSIN